ncbi:MAG: ribosome biogenesis GTPase Der [Actinomycetota bacterium]
MSPEAPRIAIVGRQNVGKSTLANRLFGRREAIAHELPGVTRDRLELETSWRGRKFTLVDTGGYRQRATGIEALVSAQAERASEEADVVLLVVDARIGVTEEDGALARRLRGTRTPVMVVANKVDSDRDELDAFVFARLGLGEPVTVSALHGRGSGDLLDRIVALLPDRSAGHELEGEPRFALVGRPNVGKSSLFNRLVGEERSVVYEEAGTTRDSVDAVVNWTTGPVRFVDTAGLRRASRTKGVEYYGFVRAVRAIERAHVVVLVLDGGEGFTGEDKRIAARVVDAGRGLVIVANKWDLVEDKQRASRTLEETAAPFARAALMRTSARSGFGVRRLVPALLDLHDRWSRRVSTSEVNRVVHDAQSERPAPHATGRFRYATQVGAGPPSFVLFGGSAPDPAYQRFLENRLRRSFGWEGVPIRLRFRPKRERRPGSD